MNLLNNHLKQLRKENNRGMEEIRSARSRQEIARMVSYMSASALSLFQIEVVRKDLIGMALEADRQQLSMTEKLGTDIKEFCDAVMETASEYPARVERVVQELAVIIRYTLFFYACEFLWMYSAPDGWGISGMLLAAVLIYFTFTRLLTIHIRNRLSLNPDTWMSRVPAAAAFLVGFAVYVVALRFFFHGRPVFLISGNGWLILALLAFAALGATLAMNWYWDRCSRKYSF